jgi:hypothetical protein
MIGRQSGISFAPVPIASSDRVPVGELVRVREMDLPVRLRLCAVLVTINIALERPNCRSRVKLENIAE